MQSFLLSFIYLQYQFILFPNICFLIKINGMIYVIFIINILNIKIIMIFLF